MDLNTFVTTLYVTVDDYIHQIGLHQPLEQLEASLSNSETITLAVLAHAPLFGSERSFYRFADRHLRRYFPRLPDLSQYNRLVRQHQNLIIGFWLHLSEQMRSPEEAYELIDTSAVPVRNLKRRGRNWLCGQASMGRGGRIGWYFGFHLLVSVRSNGAITGFGFAPGNIKEQPMADTFLAARCGQGTGWAGAGPVLDGPYLTDKGFEGKDWHRRWRSVYGVQVLCPPKTQNPISWPKALHRWVARLRQIIETVYGRLHHVFGLDKERPHNLWGFRARLSARIALHNFSLWLNQRLGKPGLEYVTLFDW